MRSRKGNPIEFESRSKLQYRAVHDDQSQRKLLHRGWGMTVLILLAALLLASAVVNLLAIWMLKPTSGEREHSRLIHALAFAQLLTGLVFAAVCWWLWRKRPKP